ncbi:MAG: PAS domain S-box protein [Desulfarculaceae bacterium]|nr:PAS domain S-box protein [Desulfarculaceae bacterium]MCF8048704.1 PAS domain S-box protein [Desulfarculaceae bacterium]MCF8064395.1 PAS domain S-box protein [Desulfarculaceae bacterium]MCF8098004.1 PAS domain S-box protein [Desulfarculaceae bacterium]MCF8122233.1 PAS domain S-box protein [Desulfarculaceae bacterium]
MSTEHLPSVDPEVFHAHYVEALQSRLKIGFLSGVFLVPAFLVVDWLQFPKFFPHFVILRLVTAAVMGLMYALNRAYRAQLWQEMLTVAGALAVAGMLEIMLLEMGPIGARYYSAMILVLIAALVLIPIRLGVAAIIGGGVLAVYIVPQIVFSRSMVPPETLLHHGGNIFGAVLLLLLANLLHRQALVRQLLLRMQVQEREKELAQLNTSLEEQVAARTADLARSESRYRSLVENNPQFIYSLDREGAFSFVGPKVKPFMGMEQDEVLGRAFADFIHRDDRYHCVKAFKELRDQGHTVNDVEFRMIRSDGQERIFLAYNSPLVDEDGQVTGVIGTAVDITRQRRLAAEREQFRRELNQTLDQLQQAAFEIVQGLAGAVEAKDPYTRGHAGRVRQVCMAMAQESGLSQDDQTMLEFAAELHDVGKIGVKGEILNKKTPLTDEEYEHIKEHPVIAEVILKDVGLLSPVRPLIRAHHERWDGTGYPDGLAGEDIPLLARIMAVADSYDAMLTQRPYRPPLSLEDTLDEIKQCAGGQFDPAVVDLFERAFRKGMFDDI